MIFLYQTGFAKEPSIRALSSNETEQTENVVTGRVTDLANGQPLVGVTVVEQGTTNGVATNVDGHFTLKVNGADSKLIFSYIGYETQVIAVSGKTKIDVQLKEDIKVLDEVVAIGYGIQKKRDVTGSIAQVKADELDNIASSQIATALQGKVAGVYIMNNSGQAGAGVDIQIRCITSLNNVSPLWVIDGVPGDQSMVNMNDVETIDIIKDGATAAIYGVRAAGGLVLVTTKRGLQQKKPKISFNAYTGISSAWRLPEMVNSDEYITLKNEQWSSKTLPVGFSLDSLGKYETTDWMEEMFKTVINEGALYYGEIRRRIIIQFTKEVRQQVYDFTDEMHLFFKDSITPPPIYKSHCKSCSLFDICLPKNINQLRSVNSYLKSELI